MLDFAGNADRGDQDNRAEQDHEKTEPIDAKRKIQPQFGRNWKCDDELKPAGGIEP